MLVCLRSHGNGTPVSPAAGARQSNDAFEILFRHRHPSSQEEEVQRLDHLLIFFSSNAIYTQHKQNTIGLIAIKYNAGTMTPR